MGYSRGTSNYPERIAQSNLNHMMSVADPRAISVEILKIDNGCYLGKKSSLN